MNTSALSSPVCPSLHTLGFAFLLALTAAPASVPAQTAPEPFRDGDRWCAIGDSITHNGTYHEVIALYYLTRFPARQVEFFNCGISGDTAGGGLQRLKWDVFPNMPTVASVMFGMNDVGRNLYGDAPPTPETEQLRRERLENYGKNQRALVSALQSAGVRVILVTPSLFDQTAELPAPKQPGVDDALAACSETVRTIAAETGAALVDFHGPMARINREGQAGDPAFTVVGPDRVHPGPAGHLLMACLFLKAQGVPALVASVNIDLKAGIVRSAENGIVENVRRSRDGLAFTWTANALPFPVEVEAQAALDWVPFYADFNREILQVTGLGPGRYDLVIDGRPLAVYTSDELARGVNLALLPTTPQYDQARIVARLLDARAKLVADNLRSLAHVEHQSAPEIEHPVTLEQMQPYLERRLASFAEHPPAVSTRRSVELYPQRKAREAESLARATELMRLAREAARPLPREYLVRPAH